MGAKSISRWEFRYTFLVELYWFLQFSSRFDMRQNAISSCLLFYVSPESFKAWQRFVRETNLLNKKCQEFLLKINLMQKLFEIPTIMMKCLCHHIYVSIHHRMPIESDFSWFNQKCSYGLFYYFKSIFAIFSF